jgi:hypothetical protein
LTIYARRTRYRGYNPPRVAPRSLFDLAIGHDNLLNGDRYKWSLRFTVINRTGFHGLTSVVRSTQMKISLGLISVALLLTVHAVTGQDKPKPWHNVRGIVVDKIGRPAVAATVYLRDTGGHRLRMKQTDQRGRFSFGPVKLDQNYEIYAEEQGATSQKVPVKNAHTGEDVVVRLVISGAR